MLLMDIVWVDHWRWIVRPKFGPSDGAKWTLWPVMIQNFLHLLGSMAFGLV